MIRLYNGCGTRRMTSTTIVLAILADTTEPTFSFLLLCVVSAIGCYSPFFLCCAAFGAAFLRTDTLVTKGAGVAAGEGADPFSFKTVRMRARSLRSERSFLSPSVCPMDIWNRSRNICSAPSRNCLSSSAGSSARNFSAFSFLCSSLTLLLQALAHHQFCRQPNFGGRQAHRFFRHGAVHAVHLKQNLARPDDGDPLFGRALALAHTSCRRFFGDGLVREQPDPHLAAALDGTGHGDARCFDLAVGDPAAFHGFQSVIAEHQRRTAPGLAGHAPALLFAILHLLRHQHAFRLLLTLLAFRRRCRSSGLAALGLSFLFPSRLHGRSHRRQHRGPRNFARRLLNDSGFRSRSLRTPFAPLARGHAPGLGLVAQP